MSDLKEFLASLAREPFAFGKTDCALILGRWWAIIHGRNPAAHLIGTYSDTAGCADVLVRHRGLLRLVHGICREIGAKRTGVPKPGDIAVVRWGRLHFGAIHTPSGKWAIKATDGLVITKDCKPLMIWSI